ncbi:hypothetical protein [Kitasatospora sp. NPDC088134]|uniref:hypothetical protein n=1 Tax=Kitasatospora sp. NPDC088134 TaxID=3364071 RepID=UPI00380F914E
MPICTSCGAAAAGAADSCANCGGRLAPAAIGEVVEVGAIGEAVEAGAGAPVGPSPWGAGRVHHARELPALSPGWLTAGRVLLAPTLLLVVTAVLCTAGDDRPEDTPRLTAVGRSGSGFQSWLGYVLTAFGTPLRASTGSSTPASKGAVVIGNTVTDHVVPYTITLAWLLALGLGLYAVARGRRRTGAAEPTARAAALQALRTGALSAAVALLLGLLGSEHTSVALTGGSLTRATTDTGPLLLPLGLSAGLAAAVLVLAVDGAAALRAEAAHRPWLGGLLLAWQHAARVAGVLLVLLTAVSAVLRLLSDGLHVRAPYVSLTVNGGLYLLGFGSGARPLLLGRPGAALYDLGDAGARWWLAALLPLLAALALGWSAHRGRLTQLDRLRLAGVYAVLTAVPVLGTSTWATVESAFKKDGRSSGLDLLGWELPSVLIAFAAWALFGALAVPAVLDAVRRSPAPWAPPRADAPPLEARVGAAERYVPEQDVPERDGGERHGLVELVLEERPRPLAAAGADGDPHAAYRRPAAD